MKSKIINVGGGDVAEIKIGGCEPLVFLGGPCAIESRVHALEMCQRIGEICDRLNIPWVYKSCYDKDSRSAVTSFHGVGIEEGLDILAEIRQSQKVPVVCDFSDANLANQTAQVVDFLQIPAYLCRQTHILTAAGKTGQPIHLKKGQFMSPWNMKNSVRKIESTGNEQILLTDRGTFFGYNMLINDYRNFPIMMETGYPVCFDATHSVQLPTSMGNVSGGQREFIPYLVRAAVGCGINALFMEVHDNPDEALSDANTQLNIRYLENILSQAKAIHETRLELAERWGDDNVHVND
ncbi:MAG: 3-deoxy-8-phosphooctulonate synthase [Rhodospirillales bacterium]